MTTHSRRKFLQSTATTGIAAATLAAFPPSIRRALAIPAHHDTGTVKDVKHVVLLMQENRSFDSYFGTFKGVRGFGDRFAVPTPNGKNVFHQTYTKTTPPSTYVPYHLDETKGNAQRAGSTPHAWSDSQAAWDHGRMYKWPDAKNQLSMGYYETAEVPFQRALADAFTLCDHYHCGMHTGTIANRLFYWSGTNGPNGVSPVDGSKVKVAALNNQFNGGNDIGASTQGWTWTTYADRLEKAGVKWKVYQSLIDNFGCNEMMGFRHWRAAVEQMPQSRRPVFVPATDITQPVTAAGPFYDPVVDDALSPLAKGFGNTMPYGFLETFRDDIRNGTLPAVSWIIAPSAYSEHPGPSSPAKGGWYVQQVLDALTANPEVWSKTVLLDQLRRERRLLRPPALALGALAQRRRHAGRRQHDGRGRRGRRVPQLHAGHHEPARDGRPPLRPRPARADVGGLALEPRRLGQLAGLRPHLDADVPREVLRRRRAADQRVPPRRLRRPHQRLQLRAPQRRAAAHAGRPQDQGRGRRADRRPAGAAEDRAADRPPLPAQATGVRPSRALPYELHTSARSDARQRPRAAAVRQQRPRRRGVPRLRQAAPGGPPAAPLHGRAGQAVERRLGRDDRRRRPLRPVGARPERLPPPLQGRPEPAACRRRRDARDPRGLRHAARRRLPADAQRRPPRLPLHRAVQPGLPRPASTAA